MVAIEISFTGVAINPKIAYRYKRYNFTKSLKQPIITIKIMVHTHKAILLLISITLLLSSCKKQSDKQDIAETESGEGESVQSNDVVLQKLYEAGKFQIADNNYALFELQGPVKSVSYSGENMGLPFDNITFDNDGTVNEVEYSDWGGETVTRLDMEFDAKNRLTALKGQTFNAQFTYRDQGRCLANLELFDQEGGVDSYHFLYDEDNKFTTVERYTEWWYDYANQDRRKETIRYKIKDLTLDHYGNWTKREIRSNKGEATTVTRKINYLDPPQLIPIESERNFFCYTTDEIGSIILYNINKLTHSVYPFTPPESILFYSYKDIKVVGNRLYTIIDTGVCGAPGIACEVLYYDTSNESWHHIITCGWDCEFVGSRIKAPIYKLTKKGACSAENEYEVTDKWIDLE